MYARQYLASQIVSIPRISTPRGLLFRPTRNQPSALRQAAPLPETAFGVRTASSNMMGPGRGGSATPAPGVRSDELADVVVAGCAMSVRVHVAHRWVQPYRGPDAQNHLLIGAVSRAGVAADRAAAFGSRR